METTAPTFTALLWNRSDTVIIYSSYAFFATYANKRQAPVRLGGLVWQMTSLISPSLRDQLLALYPEAVRESVEAVLPELELLAARLSMEVLDVELNGVPYAEAVHRAGDWPLMARLHHGLVDILQLELPPNLQSILVSALKNVDQWDGVEDLRRLVACRAAVNDHSLEAALARFALYQPIRLNLWVLYWDLPEVEALGCMKQLDCESEALLRQRLIARCSTKKFVHSKSLWPMLQCVY